MGIPKKTIDMFAGKSKLEKLSTIAKSTGTDKLPHGYITSYAEFLPDTCRTLLEIGVAEGKSAMMWHQYFGQDCDIHLVDLFENPDFKSARWCRICNFVPYQFDQSDINNIDKVMKNQFEVIIEDGSHRADHQLISFKHHFVNNLKSKGVYCVEDLHCCKEDSYRGYNGIEEFGDTILSMLQRYQKSKRIINVMFNEGESLTFENLIESVEIVNEKIAFIWKR